MVRLRLLLEDEEDRLDECRFLQIRAVTGQRMDRSSHLFLGHGQPKAGEGGDQIVVLSLHWSGTLLHRFLLPFCVKENRFPITAHPSANYLGTLLRQVVIENGTVACPLWSGEYALFLELVVPGLADAQLLAQFSERDEASPTGA